MKNSKKIGDLDMFCKNCGQDLTPEALFCPKCGYNKGTGSRFCANCGNELAPGAHVCGKCGYSEMQQQQQACAASTQKSRLAAGLLGILLGCWGVHNFYLGNTGKAVAQLLLGTLGALACGVGILASSIWGLIEGIMILCESINTDGKGLPLKE